MNKLAEKATAKTSTKKPTTRKVATKDPEPQAEPLNLIEATKTGDRLQTLYALRDLLADKLQNTDCGRDVASMSRRLMQCVSEIETLEQLKKDKEECKFSLHELRKQYGLDKHRLDQQYKLGSMSTERERH